MTTTKLSLSTLALLLLLPTEAAGQDQDTRWVRQVIRQQFWSWFDRFIWPVT